jgi:uncharacterized OB-fold protein
MHDPGPEQQFFAHLGEGRFMIQRSASSGEYVFFPRVAAPGSATRDLHWVEASGRGVVYSTTTVRRRPERGGDYNVVLVDLEEGPRMMSRVVGIPSTEVRIGMTVRARIDTSGDAPVVVFEPVETAE